jgi:hypothetical protein
MLQYFCHEKEIFSNLLKKTTGVDIEGQPTYVCCPGSHPKTPHSRNMKTVHFNSFALRQLEGIDDLPELPSAKNVSIILYSHDTLLENDGEAESDCDYEIVTVLPHQAEYGQTEPMTPETLMANHFEVSGGTPTNMTPEQFQEALEFSFLYWRDKAMIAGRKSYWRISNEDLVARTKQALRYGYFKQGYREGVLEVFLEAQPGEFFTPVVTLKEGDKLEGEFKARREGEEPRKSIGKA